VSFHLVTLAAIVFGPLLVEARRAAHNERAQRVRGGVEPPRDVYRVMRIAYPGAFLAMVAEGVAHGSPPPKIVVAGVAIFAAAKVIKWWAILALGPFWTFRVIVVPGTPLVVTGPYRWLRHPNYVGVIGELAGLALMTGAVVSGVAAIATFGVLLTKRIAVEERMLETLPDHGSASRPSV
jgi:methyltransferase